MKKLCLALGLWLGLVLPAPAVVQQTQVGNVAYSITTSDTTVVTTVAFSAARIWTLPAAGGTCIGQTCPANSLSILDLAGAITSTNTLTITPQSGETINGNTGSLIISAAGAKVYLTPTSGSNWQAVINGDYRSIAVATANAVALTSTTAADIATISLSQGDWSCAGAITRKLAASTSVTLLKTSISATTATSGSLDTGTMVEFATAANVMATDTTMTIGPIRLTPTATTSYFLVAQDTFSVSTNAGYGQLNCRRM